jgi:hypothetical protein
LKGADLDILIPPPKVSIFKGRGSINVGKTQHWDLVQVGVHSN